MKSRSSADPPPRSGPAAAQSGRCGPSLLESNPERAALRGALLDHYDEHRRRLPWREEADPYRILVSEVMLQQTRVETVLDYYGPWLDRFPDLASLAAADSDEVLEAWQGLGYYRRAKNLHRAARVVRDRHGGSLPASYDRLRELPGIGEYTAGAVASIAFGLAVPAPDGNVRRVLARLFDEPTPKPAWIRETAARLVDPERPGDWNQALMDLGATVCTPRAPQCGRCPLSGWCAALAVGTQEKRPAPVERRAPRMAVFALAVVHRAGAVLLRRRPEEGLLGGMWAFPEVEVGSAPEAREAVLDLVRRLGLEGAGAEPLPPCEHRFTHLAAIYLPFLVDGEGASDPADATLGQRQRGAESTWVTKPDPDGVALPVAQRRILESALEHVAGGRDEGAGRGSGR